MKMRKVMVAFLAAICIFTSLSICALGASAEGTNRVYAEVSTSAAQGSYQYCYVYLEDLTDLASLSVAVHYDSQKIEMDYTYNRVSCDLYDYSNQNGCLQYSYIFNGDSSGQACLFYFRYKVKEDAPTGNSFFDITISDAYNTSLEPVQISGARYSFQITPAQQKKQLDIYNYDYISTAVKEEFELTYYVSTYDIASGAFSIQYDPELFEFVELTSGGLLDGRMVDVNSELPGAVYVSFVGTEQSYSTDLVKVKFRTKKNVTSTSQIKLVAKDFYDADLNNLICNGCTSNIAISFDDTYTEDAPGMILTPSYDAQNNKLTVTIKLEKGSHLGAGDFTLRFDPAAISYCSATKGFSPTYFTVNDKNTKDGTLKFSIISLTDITEEQTVLQIVFDVKHSCVDKLTDIQISGSGLTDSMTTSIMLNFVDCTVSIHGAHNHVPVVTPPTCTEQGYTTHTCSYCGDNYKDTYVDAHGHKDVDKNHQCDYNCGENIGTCEDANKDHKCDYGCDKNYGTCEDANKDHKCDYGCTQTFGTCVDNNKDHKCDYGCSQTFGSCEDTDKDHKCDYGCDKNYGTCVDNNKDHKCDYGCGKAYGTCEDANKDHKCDYGCDKNHGTCEDANKDHKCDYGCDKNYSTCEDANKDHKCDYGCGKAYGTCEDTNKDHKCDYGCGKNYGTCEDANKDHKCDYGCDKNYGTCEDANKDHKCDYGCIQTFGSCVDNNKDHKCDYGCSKTFGTCKDADKDHQCDYGCGKNYGTCEDTDKDHKCDYGCSKTYGICEDANNDHLCDYGCGKTYGTCVDNNKDHKCDCGCGKTYGTCEDANKDHLCDYGCNKNYGTCEDANKDHKCDYGCTQTFGTCEDTNKDHKCDYGCDKNYGTCVDNNNDHKCDYGCSQTFGTCEDADKNHKCDYGCGKAYGTCEDANKDHKCDYGCDKNYGTCEDANKDHKCDYGCTQTFGTCEDADKNHKCDYGCNKNHGACEDLNKDHKCDYGCGKKLNDHTYTDVVTSPTCIAQGYTTHTCSYCGDNYKDAYVDALGHSYTASVAKEATVAEFGERAYTCHCGDRYTEQIPKLAPEIIDNAIGAVWNDKSDKVLSFRSNAAIEDFVEVRVNGKVIDRSCYTVREGSTIVELLPDYLRTLDAGQYTVSIVSTTGVAEAQLTIEANSGSSSLVIVLAVASITVVAAVCIVLISKKRSIHSDHSESPVD